MASLETESQQVTKAHSRSRRNSPIGHALVEQSHVTLPEVGGNLDMPSAHVRDRQSAVVDRPCRKRSNGWE